MILNALPQSKDLVIIQRSDDNAFYGETHISGSNLILYIDSDGHINADDSRSFYNLFPASGSDGGTTLYTGSTYQITASWAENASNADTASYAFTSSYELEYQTSSSYASQSFTATSASWASQSLSALSALTADFSLDTTFAISASWAPTNINITASAVSVVPANDNALYNIVLAESSSATSPSELSIAGGSTSIISVNPSNGNFNVGGSITAASVSSSLFGTASWSINSTTASYVSSSNITGYVTSLSASWSSASLSSSYAGSSSIANTASYIAGANVIGTVVSSSYAKNAQLIIDMDWHLVRNSNTNIQTTHNFVPGSIILARNGLICTADYITTEYDYVESGSNQIQLHFTMSTETKMMCIYALA